MLCFSLSLFSLFSSLTISFLTHGHGGRFYLSLFTTSAFISQFRNCGFESKGLCKIPPFVDFCYELPCGNLFPPFLNFNACCCFFFICNSGKNWHSLEEHVKFFSLLEMQTCLPYTLLSFCCVIQTYYFILFCSFVNGMGTGIPSFLLSICETVCFFFFFFWSFWDESKERIKISMCNYM